MRKKITYVLVTVFSGVIGGLIGFFGMAYLDQAGVEGLDYLGILIVLCAAVYLQLILHEAGHFVFGLLSGYRFVSFRVGSLTIYKKAGKIQIGSYKLAGTGGQCLMTPPELKEGKIPYRAFNLGGSIMNVIISGIALLLFLITNPGPVMGVFWIALIFVGILFALTNGIPMQMNGVDNDGYNALSLGKNDEALRAFWLQLKVNEMLTEGIRLRDMPEEWFQEPSKEGMKNNMIAAIEAMRCNRMMDMHSFEEMNVAASKVVHGENNMVGIQKMLLQIDQVFCECIGEKRTEILKQIESKQLKSFMKAMKNFPSVVRTQYAYALLIKQDAKESARLKKHFEKVMKKHPYQSELESELELIKICEGLASES